MDRASSRSSSDTARSGDIPRTPREVANDKSRPWLERKLSSRDASRIEARESKRREMIRSGPPPAGHDAISLHRRTMWHMKKEKLEKERRELREFIAAGPPKGDDVYTLMQKMRWKRLHDMYAHEFAQNVSDEEDGQGHDNPHDHGATQKTTPITDDDLMWA